MSEPTTRMDPRFSDADGEATSWEDSRKVLEDAELFWIATVREDGRPHVTPLVAVWMDGALFFSTAHRQSDAALNSELGNLLERAVAIGDGGRGFLRRGGRGGLGCCGSLRSFLLRRVKLWRIAFWRIACDRGARGGVTRGCEACFFERTIQGLKQFVFFRSQLSRIFVEKFLDGALDSLVHLLSGGLAVG